MMAAANASAPSRSDLATCWASRAAVFGPMPGRWESSETRREKGSSGKAGGEPLEQTAQTRSQVAHAALNRLVDLARSIARERARDAARRAAGRKRVAESAGIDPRHNLRRSVAATLIHAGLRLFPEYPIRGPSQMRAK